MQRSTETLEWYRKLLSPLNPEEPIEVYFLALQSKHGPSTIRRYYVGVKTFFSWARAEGYLTRDPLANFPKPKAPKRLIKPLNRDQVKMVLGQFKSTFCGLRNRAITMLICDSGLRASEVVGLQVQSVDWERQIVTVIGKGDKERAVPFGGQTKLALMKFHARCGLPNRRSFFVNWFGKTMNRRQLNLLYSRIKVPFRVHPHLLRHTMATEYIRNGGDPVSLKEILGHSTLEQVMVYVNLASEDMILSHRRFSPMDNL